MCARRTAQRYPASVDGKVLCWVLGACGEWRVAYGVRGVEFENNCTMHITLDVLLVLYMACYMWHVGY